jgi:hypothetical protein
MGEDGSLCAPISEWAAAMEDVGVGIKSEKWALRMTPEGDLLRVEATSLIESALGVIVGTFKLDEYSNLLKHVTAQIED